MGRVSRSALVCVIFLATLAACRDDQPQQADTPPTTLVESFANTGDYTNGRHLAKIVEFEDLMLTFDVVQLLFGEEAKAAWIEDGGEKLQTDYYFRNQDEEWRTLPVSPDVSIAVNVSAGYEPFDDHLVSSQTFADYIATRELEGDTFWLTIADGRVMKIAEQSSP